MADEGELKLDYTAFNNALARVLVQSKRDAIAVLKDQAKFVVRNIIAITPPASITKTQAPTSTWNVVLGAEAKKAGEIAMKTDLLGGRRGGGGTGSARRAGIFTILSESIIANQAKVEANAVRLWVTKDGRVYGTQNTLYRPNASSDDLKSWHARYFQNGRMSSAGSYDRNIGRWKWIDQMVISKAAFDRYFMVAKSRVGFLAAGWNQAAAMLGYRPPAWVWRHSAPGSGTVEVTEEGVRVKMTNRVGYASAIKDMARRVQYALNQQAGNLNRQADNFMRRMFERNGFKVAA